MTYYAPLLVTLDYVRQHRGVSDAQTKDDALLLSLIQENSADFMQALQRIPMPYVDTKRFSAINVSGYDLKLRDDLLAVTSVTNGNGESVASNLYNLRPDNQYPKHTVELISNGGTGWALGYSEDRIAIAGTWGYAPHYPTAWRSLTTLGANVSDTTTRTITLASTSDVEIGMYLSVGSETFGYVTDKSNTTVTVDERGALGTTAATASSGATVSAYRQIPDIMKAVRSMVVYAYTSKDKIGGSTRIYDDGTLIVEDLDPAVEQTRKRHMRKHLPKAV